MGPLKRLKKLPVSTKRLLGLGVVLALTVALPLFIWAILTQRFELREKAATGEPDQCTVTFTDSFPGPQIDENSWIPAGDILWAQGGSVVINGVANQTNNQWLLSKNSSMTGDFVMEVEIPQFTANTTQSYELATAELKAYGDDSNYFTLRWVKWQNGSSQINLLSVKDGYYNQSVGVVIPTDASVKLRLARNGSYILGHYDLGSGFIQLPELPAGVFTGTVRPMLYSHAWTLQGSIAAFDNFSLQLCGVDIQTPTGQPTAEPTPTPTDEVGGTQQGEPNFCGGTCGSNYNCQAGFFCYEGYCRNPLCREDENCDCITPTPSPTTKPKGTLKSSATPRSTGEIIFLTPPPTGSPRPRISPTGSAFPLPTESTSLPSAKKPNIFLYIGGASLGLAIILLIANTLRKK